MTLRATEVFTPGSFPTYTYVERSEERLESSLRDAVDTAGQVVSLSGPSKSGKTVLVERVIGQDNLIPITGAGVTSAEDVWERVLDWMNVPQSTAGGRSTSGSVGGEAGARGGASLFGLAKTEIAGKATVEATTESQRSSSYQRRGLPQVVEEIGSSTFVILLDDFHYMPRPVQAEAAKAIKEAVRLGLKIITASVSHRGDDVVRANPELRGRVRAIDLAYWKSGELREIADLGFGMLNAQIARHAIDVFVSEAAGSPQLMQSICLNTCFHLKIRDKLPIPRMVDLPDDAIADIFEQTSASTDFRSLVDVLEAGPRTRGTERKVYTFGDGTQGDVYRCVLKAIAADPPRLSFDYDELSKRAAHVCKGDVPVGSSIIGTCLHMNRLALDKFPDERVIDWDEQRLIFDVPDPYLLFYLRWSRRLMETGS